VGMGPQHRRRRTLLGSSLILVLSVAAADRVIPCTRKDGAVLDEKTIVTVGVDTHSDVHVAAALDHLGPLLTIAASLRRPVAMRSWPPRPSPSGPSTRSVWKEQAVSAPGCSDSLPTTGLPSSKSTGPTDLRDAVMATLLRPAHCRRLDQDRDLALSQASHRP